MHTKLKLLVLSVTLLTLAARTTIPVMAQNPTGSIRGTVTDQSGAIIQNAAVTVTNKATGDVRKVSTGNDGIFAVENLLPAEYEVKIEAPNFATESIQEFQISTFSFDLSTGVTSVGAINIVSRTGSNSVHGNAFLFYRDHTFAAIPTFFRPSATFDPFFRRYQYGGSLGGPIK